MSFVSSVRHCLVLIAAAACAALISTPSHADPVLATSGSYLLTQQLASADITWSEWVAKHSFTPEERREITAIDVAEFRRDPKWATEALRSQQRALVLVHGYSPFWQADMRHAAIIRAFFRTPDRNMSAGEIQAYQRLMSRYVKPVIIVAESLQNVVVTPADVEAGYAATRFFASQLKVTPPTAPQYAELIARMRTHPTDEYRLPIFLNFMEEKWIATQAMWKVLDAPGRRRLLGSILVADRRNPYQLARAVPEACGVPQSTYTLLYREDGTPTSHAEAMQRFMVRRQGMELMTNTFNRGQEQIRQQNQEDAQRRHYEENACRR